MAHIIKQLSPIFGLVNIDLRGQISMIGNVSIVMRAVGLAALLLLDGTGDGRYGGTACQ
ncbi:hypothetical protein X777_12709 [Ooceraea biroi]|uniref:Uncharacterized protein n=1 Tax=Ooceraea biroi TaxID=2015173 RepID=A0A026VYA7_OOCBI|nr:hypothetical protein X777_12709 [Ooceraea biroi]